MIGGKLEEFAGAEREDMTFACQRAYDQLDDREQCALDKIMVDLESAMRARRPTGQGLGQQSRLELLAKLGLWLKDRGR